MQRAFRTLDSLSRLGLCPIVGPRALPYTDEGGLRDYRNAGRPVRAPWPLWPWLLPIAFGLGLAIGGWR